MLAGHTQIDKWRRMGCCLFLVAVVLLGGCAAPSRPVPVEIERPVAESTWREIECAIAGRATEAEGPAESFARGEMERWKLLVGHRTEKEFIPWYSGYWTQRWLSVKSAWYRLSSGEDAAGPEKKLAAYLQDEYRNRVLQPVAGQVDFDTVRSHAAKIYLERLRELLVDLPGSYLLSERQFNDHLQTLPVIQLGPPSSRDAALSELLARDGVARQPAFLALNEHLQQKAQRLAGKDSSSRLTPVAQRISEKLVGQLAISGGSSAVSTLVGGVAGTAISIGAVGLGVVLHEMGREAQERELRDSLSLALDDAWLELVEDRESGVLSGVAYLSSRIVGLCRRPPAGETQMNTAETQNEGNGSK